MRSAWPALEAPLGLDVGGHVLVGRRQPQLKSRVVVVGVTSILGRRHVRGEGGQQIWCNHCGWIAHVPPSRVDVPLGGSQRPSPDPEDRVLQLVMLSAWKC